MGMEALVTYLSKECVDEKHISKRQKFKNTIGMGQLRSSDTCTCEKISKILKYCVILTFCPMHLLNTSHIHI